MQSEYLQSFMKINADIGQEKANSNPILERLSIPLNYQINVIYRRIVPANDVIILNL